MKGNMKVLIDDLDTTNINFCHGIVGFLCQYKSWFLRDQPMDITKTSFLLTVKENPKKSFRQK